MPSLLISEMTAAEVECVQSEAEAAYHGDARFDVDDDDLVAADDSI